MTNVQTNDIYISPSLCCNKNSTNIHALNLTKTQNLKADKSTEKSKLYITLTCYISGVVFCRRNNYSVAFCDISLISAFNSRVIQKNILINYDDLCLISLFDCCSCIDCSLMLIHLPVCECGNFLIIAT